MIGKVRGIKSEGARDTEGERVEGESLGGVEGERDRERERGVDVDFVCFVGCLTSQQHVSVSHLRGGRWRERGRIIGEREIWRGIEAGRVGGRERAVGGEV